MQEVLVLGPDFAIGNFGRDPGVVFSIEKVENLTLDSIIPAAMAKTLLPGKTYMLTGDEGKIGQTFWLAPQFLTVESLVEYESPGKIRRHLESHKELTDLLGVMLSDDPTKWVEATAFETGRSSEFQTSYGRLHRQILAVISPQIIRTFP